MDIEACISISERNAVIYWCLNPSTDTHRASVEVKHMPAFFCVHEFANPFFTICAGWLRSVDAMLHRKSCHSSRSGDYRPPEP